MKKFKDQIHFKMNYQKQKKKVALCHEKIRNQRKDYHHKLSRKIADMYDVVVVEDLNMKAMKSIVWS